MDGDDTDFFVCNKKLSNLNQQSTCVRALLGRYFLKLTELENFILHTKKRVTI